MSKQTPETLKKLEDAFAIDASVEEACFYADISIQTYYNWVKENPKLLERFNALRQKPILKARQEVINGLEGNPQFSFQYLKAKRAKEFSEKMIIEHQNEDTDPENDKLIQEYEEKARKNLQKSITNKTKDHE